MRTLFALLSLTGSLLATVPASAQLNPPHALRWSCGSYRSCVLERSDFTHHGYTTTNIYYCEMVATCPTGYYFDYWK